MHGNLEVVLATGPAVPKLCVSGILAANFWTPFQRRLNGRKSLELQRKLSNSNILANVVIHHMVFHKNSRQTYERPLWGTKFAFRKPDWSLCYCVLRVLPASSLFHVQLLLLPSLSHASCRLKCKTTTQSSHICLQSNSFLSWIHCFAKLWLNIR